MRKTVLVVEDSASSRDLTVHFLQQAGYRVLEAEDGEQALAILAREPVDLILADVMMPKMDGWELSRRVRAEPRYAMTPIVFLTVINDLEQQVKALSMHIDDYLTKPITPQQLVARVNTAIERAERIRRYLYKNPA
ncbi:MAG: response regulator, partial [Zetaproteobacteria bacterium]